MGTARLFQVLPGRDGPGSAVAQGFGDVVPGLFEAHAGLAALVQAVQAAGLVVVRGGGISAVIAIRLLA